MVIKRSITFFLLYYALNLFAQEGMVGHWTFDDPNNLLKATVGSDLTVIGTHTAIAGPDSGNGAVNVGIGSYYIVQHNIAPNDGGSRVNEFTIIMDIKVSQLGRWYTLYQVNPLNTDDGEWFIDTLGKMGVNATGYTEPVIGAGKWYRLAIAVKNGFRYDYYIDGQLVLNGEPNGIDERFSLGTSVLLFADENSEDNHIDVAEVMIFSRALEDIEIESLGGYNSSEPEEPIDPILTVNYTVNNELLITVDPEIHMDYGLSYPLTYEIEIPAGYSDLQAYKSHSIRQEWTALTEKKTNDFFNGIETVRFDYTSRLAYVSASFSSETDSIYIKICDTKDENVPIVYQRICEYYDNRKAAVTSSADDWADSGEKTWYQSDEEFQITCRQFRKYHLWLSCGIITQYCNATTWQHIQTQLDSGYVEACSHSRTHSYGPYDDPLSEIAGSKQDIFDNLDLPASFKSGEKEYIYTWIAPANYYDEIVNNLVGENKYLVNRRYNWPFDRFAEWNYKAGYFHTIGISREASPIWQGTTDLTDLNAYFDEVLAKGGIYHVMTHPYFLLENGFNDAHYAWEHLKYISNKTNIWYVSVGHLYLYHYLQGNEPLTISVPNSKNRIVPEFVLDQNYPNPFNAFTHISFQIFKKTRVRLSIYTINGRLVDVLVNEDKDRGLYSVRWDANNYSSGVYFYKLDAGDFSLLNKCILIK